MAVGTAGNTMAVDPNPTELVALHTLDDVRDWTGAADLAGNLLLADFRRPVLRREMVLISRDAWTVTAFQYPRQVLTGVAVEGTAFRSCRTYTDSAPRLPRLHASTCKEVESSGKNKGKDKGDTDTESTTCPSGKAHLCNRCSGQHGVRNGTFQTERLHLLVVLLSLLLVYAH